MTSQIESFNTTLYALLYQNEQIEREIMPKKWEDRGPCLINLGDFDHLSSHPLFLVIWNFGGMEKSNFGALVLALSPRPIFTKVENCFNVS